MRVDLPRPDSPAPKSARAFVSSLGGVVPRFQYFADPLEEVALVGVRVPLAHTLTNNHGNELETAPVMLAHAHMDTSVARMHAGRAGMEPDASRHPTWSIGPLSTDWGLCRRVCMHTTTKRALPLPFILHDRYGRAAAGRLAGWNVTKVQAARARARVSFFPRPAPFPPRRLVPIYTGSVQMLT